MKSNQIYERSKNLIKEETIYKELEEIIKSKIDIIREQGLIEYIDQYYEHTMLSMEEGFFQDYGKHLSLEEVNKFKVDFIASLYLLCIDLELDKSMIKQCRENAEESVYKQYIDSAASDDALYNSIILTLCGSAEAPFDTDYYNNQINYLNDCFLK